MAIKIAPSILSADFGQLATQIQEAESAGADYIHIDVMDGQFVPNITIGPLIVQAARRATSLPLDVHLMIVEPQRYVEAFAQAGADIITIHVEATPHAHRAVQLIHKLNCKAGLALNPFTPISYLQETLSEIDLALVMSVNPGFGGQAFIPSSLERIAKVKTWRDASNPQCKIEVDGGVNLDNAKPLAEAGVDILVAGSSIFNFQGIKHNIQAFKSLLA